MGNRVFLNIESNNGVVVIPFIGIKELDYFTVGYENDKELVESLSKMMDLSLNIEDVLSIYITSNKYKYTKNNSLSCIKYRDDNYNVDSLREMLSLYLRQDHRRIRRCDVRYVVTDGMVKFNGGMSISDRDIDLAVKIFLKSDYKKQRDMYFMIKNFGSIKIDKLSKEDRDKLVISNMSTNDEEGFVQYLIELSSRDEDKLNDVIEELSRVDLEDISRVLESSKGRVFDGLMRKDSECLEDLYALESLSGMDIEQLKELQVEYNKIYGYRR